MKAFDALKLKTLASKDWLLLVVIEKRMSPHGVEGEGVAVTSEVESVKEFAADPMSYE